MIRRSLLIAALLVSGSAVVLFLVLANPDRSPLSDPMPYRRLVAPVTSQTTAFPTTCVSFMPGTKASASAAIRNESFACAN
jgi:hypothetical protein